MATIPVFESGATNNLVSERLLVLDDLLDLAERAQAHTHAAGCAVAIKMGDALLVRTSTGQAPPVGARFACGEGLVGRCTQTPYCDAPAESDLDPALAAFAPRSLMLVPVRAENELLGVLIILAPAPGAFNRMHVAIVLAMSSEAVRVLRRLKEITAEPVPISAAPVSVPVRPSVEPTSAPVVTRSSPPVPALPISSPAKVVAPQQKSSITRVVLDDAMAHKLATAMLAEFEQSQKHPAEVDSGDLAAEKLIHQISAELMPEQSAVPHAPAPPAEANLAKPAPGMPAAAPRQAPVPQITTAFARDAEPANPPKPAPPIPGVTRQQAPVASIAAAPEHSAGAVKLSKATPAAPAAETQKASVPNITTAKSQPATKEDNVAKPASVPAQSTPPLPDITAAVLERNTAQDELAKPAPELLAPGEDPLKYGSVMVPALRDKASPATIGTGYNLLVRKRRRWREATLFFAAAAAVLVLIAVAVERRSNAVPAQQTSTIQLSPAPVAQESPSVATVSAEAAPTVAPSSPKPVVTKTTANPPAHVAEQPPSTKPHEAEASTHVSEPVVSRPEMTIAAATPKPALPDPVEAPAFNAVNIGSNGAAPALPAPRTAAPSLLRTSVVTPAAAIHTVAPFYPLEARSRGITGEVRLHVTISETGRVTNVRVDSGPALLRQAAMDAVRKWQYRPAVLDGHTVGSSADVVVKFSAPQ